MTATYIQNQRSLTEHQKTQNTEGNIKRKTIDAGAKKERNVQTYTVVEQRHQEK